MLATLLQVNTSNANKRMLPKELLELACLRLVYRCKKTRALCVLEKNGSNGIECDVTFS